MLAAAATRQRPSGSDPIWRGRFSAPASAAALLVIAALAIYAIGEQALQQQLSARAWEALQHLRAGSSPFEWSMTSSRDLVRRGSLEGDRAQVDPGGGLSLVLGGSESQLSLRLDRRAIDLVRYPLLRLEIESSGQLGLNLLGVSAVDGRRLASAPIPLTAGENVLRMPLSELRDVDGKPAQALDTLVLRLQGEPDTRLKLRRVRIDVAATARQLDWPPAFQPLPQGPDALAELAVRFSTHALPWPVFQVTHGWVRPERVLADIDALKSAVPAAIVLPARPQEVAAAAPSWPSFVHSALLISWASALLFFRLRPGRRRHWPDLLLAFGPGLWLVVNGHYAMHTPPWAMLLIALSLAYGLSLMPRRHELAAPQGAGPWLVWGLPVLSALALAGLLMICSNALGTAERPLPDGSKLLRYAAWVGVQQALLGPVLCRGLRDDFPLSAAATAAIAATLFALLHVPNTALALLTLVGAWLWAMHWLHFQRWLPLALSHWIAALACFQFLPGDWLRSAEAGSRFFI